MDYEKAYKEALERAKKVIEYYKEHHRCDEASIEDLECIFPELKESEDERIRKEIIQVFKGQIPFTSEECAKKYIAWLEKQGEQKPFDYENANIQQKDFAPKEPKFKVGDWVVHNKANFVFQVVSIGSYGYEVINRDDYTKRISFDNEVNYHLWTIEDAKDGDVLASKDKEDILIYKSNSVIELLLTSHISFSKKEGFCPRQYSAWDSNEFIPATKEQRDLLFSKMHEARYMWDSDSKQLLSLKAEPSGEQKPTGFKIGDDITVNGEVCKVVAVEQEPAWSEEDESIALGIESLVSCASLLNIAPDRLDKVKDWLKSLKERYTWKPSDEQIKALHDLNLTGNVSYAGQGQTLIELYNDLKKLKGE